MVQSLSLQAAPPSAFLQAATRRSRLRSRQSIQPSAFFNLRQSNKGSAGAASGAVNDLLAAIEGTEKGLVNKNSAAIEAAVQELKRLGSGTTTTDSSKLSGTWRMLWTTEKETLFIVKNASWFKTEAGEVYQVIDVPSSTLQNVITFPPKGAFIVNSSINIAGPQRTEFQFTAATLKLPDRSISLPPFGKGWFDTVYIDSKIRVAQDVRGDTLVVTRDGPPQVFS